MTDLTTVSFPFNTSILSSTMALVSTNISADKIIEITNASSTIISTSAHASVPIWAGFIGCLVATFFFGSNLIPVKQFSVGDGLFFQFVFCVAAYIVGLIVDLIMNNQRFYPLVLIGGVLWSTGSLVSVFCIKTVGLAVGVLIWGTTSLVTGWATGRFGILGIKPQVPSTQTKLILNYISVILAAISAIFFLFIKSTNAPSKSRDDDLNDEQIPTELIKTDLTVVETVKVLETDFPFLNYLSDPIQKTLGCGLAALAGIFYGTMFIPDQYIRDHPEKFIYKNDIPPQNGLYYVSSQYSGVLLSTFFYFVIYALCKRNRPSINPIIAVPAIISGTMWAIANIGFIVAISALSSAVAYPIVSVLPGIVISLWSLFWFREIQGRRNLIFLSCGMLVRCLAALLSGLSA